MDSKGATSSCLLPDATAQAGKDRTGGRERVIYFSFFIQSPLKELFTNPKDDKRILKIEITCHCQFRLSEEFPNIPQFQLVETFFDEQLGNFDGCVHMLDSVFKGVGCSFILYRTINKNVYPNGSYDYKHYCNEIDRLRAEVAVCGSSTPAERLQRVLLEQSGGCKVGGDPLAPGAGQTDSLFSSFSVTNSTVSKMFRELENDLPAAWRCDTSAEAAPATKAAAAVSASPRSRRFESVSGGSGSGCTRSDAAHLRADRPGSTSQDSLDSLEEFSCLEVAVDRLEDIVNDNYEFVIEEMFFEAITTEVSAEVWRGNLRQVGARLLEGAIREHVARCCIVSQSVSHLAKSLVEPTKLVDQTCADCLNDNFTVVCTSVAQSTACPWGCEDEEEIDAGGCCPADTYCDFDYDDEDDEHDDVDNDEKEEEEEVEEDGRAPPDENRSAGAYECDSTMDISESLLDRRWSNGAGASQWNSSRLLAAPGVCAGGGRDWLGRLQTQPAPPPPPPRASPPSATSQTTADALEDMFNGWCLTLAEEACLDTLVGLIAHRLVVVLYKSSCSKSQFECRVVKALACFNQSLGLLATQPDNQLDLTTVVDAFFNFVVDTVMDPDALRMGHMSGVVAALQAPTTVGATGLSGLSDRAGGCSGNGWQLLETTRDAFARAVRDQLSSLSAKLQRKTGTGTQRMWQIRGAKQAAVEVFEVASNSSSDELDSLPSESAAVVAKTKDADAELAAAVAAAATGRKSRATGFPKQQSQLPPAEQQHPEKQHKFRRRLERINEAIQPPLTATEVDGDEQPALSALPLPACAPSRRLRPPRPWTQSEAAEAASDEEVDAVSESGGGDTLDHHAVPMLRACAASVRAAPAASGSLGVWEATLLQRCQGRWCGVREVAADNPKDEEKEAADIEDPDNVDKAEELFSCGLEECLTLECPIVGHASQVADGRAGAVATVAVVAEAGAPLHACAADVDGSRVQRAVAAASVETPASELLEFAPVKTPAEAPSVSVSLHQPPVQLHLAVARFSVRILDALEQCIRPVQCPPNPLNDRPVSSTASLSTSLVGGLRRAAWTVHAGVRPSGSHCCPLAMLPSGLAETCDHLAASHGLVNTTPSADEPAQALELAAISATRFAAASAVELRDVGAAAFTVRRSGGGNSDSMAVAHPLCLCSADGQSGQRSAASSWTMPAPHRALANASDRPAAGGGKHWPVHPVREWRCAQAFGSLRPALTAPAAAGALAARVASPAELIDAGGCVGRLPTAPVDAVRLSTIDAGAGGLQTVAIDCGVTVCLPVVEWAPLATELVSAGRLTASQPPLVRRCIEADDSGCHSDSCRSSTIAATPILQAESAQNSNLPPCTLAPFADQTVAFQPHPGNCPATTTTMMMSHHFVGRSHSTSSLSSAPSSIDDLLSSLARQQNLLDRLYVEKFRSRRSGLNDSLLTGFNSF